MTTTAVTLKIPAHIAIIMDGNGRWAKEQGLQRILGHESGAETVREITREFLALSGYTVLEAKDGIEALEAARPHVPEASATVDQGRVLLEGGSTFTTTHVQGLTRHSHMYPEALCGMA